MKKTLLITGVLLALTASAASADTGVALYWQDCGTSTMGTTNRTFACTNNVGTNQLILSVDPPTQVTMTSGHNHILDLQSASPTLPDWWQYKNVGTCRVGAMTASGDFSNTPSSGVGCAEVWPGVQGTGDVAGYAPGFGGDPSRARVIGNISIGSDFAGPMNVGTEYYSIRFQINNTKTVGTGACAGCLTPVCLVLNEVRIGQLVGTPGGDQAVTNPIPGLNNFVTWQGEFPSPGCPGATPTKNTTWGKIKSIYR